MVRFLLCVLLLLLIVPVASAQDEIRYTGEINDDTPSQEYEFDLESGQSVLITTEATRGDLDTTLALRAPNGALLTSNDDRDSFTLDSIVGLTAQVSGTYTVTVGRFDAIPGYETSGEYELVIAIGEDDILNPLREIVPVDLSGRPQRIETEHFVIHYTTRGADETTETYAQAVAVTFEEVYTIQILRLGWDVPPSDGLRGGDDRIDIFLIDLMDEFGFGPYGYTSHIDIVGDNPNTPGIETRAAASYIGLENDFSETEAPLDLMRTTVAHEFHHVIQLGYDFRDLHSWYYEATATYMEFVTLGKELDALRWTEYNFTYPEYCFGTDFGDPYGGAMRYGEWMFLQSLEDAHGVEAVQKLWRNIGQYEGFEALERTLALYNETVPEALARYRVQNLLRDYDLAANFNSTVWVDEAITAVGDWENTLDGVQELSANYFSVALEPGTYQVRIDSEQPLDVWVITVRGAQAEVIRLGSEGVFTMDAETYQYLMVFNPSYDDEVNDCSFEDYTLQISAAPDGALSGGGTGWNAEYFTPPGLRE